MEKCGFLWCLRWVLFPVRGLVSFALRACLVSFALRACLVSFALRARKIEEKGYNLERSENYRKCSKAGGLDGGIFLALRGGFSLPLRGREIKRNGCHCVATEIKRGG